MKKLSVLLLLFASTLLLQNCKKDTKDDDQNAQVTESDAKMMVESDNATDDILDLVDLYGFENGSSTRSRALPSCVTQTVVRSGHNVTITWEFDPNGCAMPNGNTYQGTVTIARNVDLSAMSITGSVSFDQFYVNGINIAGGTQFTRVRSNANGNPKIEHNFDLTVTFPNGDVAIRQGTRTREWVQGFGTPMHTDDIFLITGNAHVQFRNGVVIDYVITSPLHREPPCRYFVSGTVEITKNGQTAILDYGNGNCDNEATLTLPNGTVRVIHLP